MENRRRSMYGGVDVGPIEQLAALVAQQQDLVDALELDKSEKNDTIHALTVSFSLGSDGGRVRFAGGIEGLEVQRRVGIREEDGGIRRRVSGLNGAIC